MVRYPSCRACHAPDTWNRPPGWPARSAVRGSSRPRPEVGPAERARTHAGSMRTDGGSTRRRSRSTPCRSRRPRLAPVSPDGHLVYEAGRLWSARVGPHFVCGRRRTQTRLPAEVPCPGRFRWALGPRWGYGVAPWRDAMAERRAAVRCFARGRGAEHDRSRSALAGIFTGEQRCLWKHARRRCVAGESPAHERSESPTADQSRRGGSSSVTRSRRSAPWWCRARIGPAW
jgi:hypothetical protein